MTAFKSESKLFVGNPTIPHKEEAETDSAIKEYDAKVDSKKHLTLRESPFEYYHVVHYPDGRILLQSRQLVEPIRVSENTLNMMDKSMENVHDKSNAYKKITLSDMGEVLK